MSHKTNEEVFAVKRKVLVILLCSIFFMVSNVSAFAGSRNIVFADLSWDSIQFHNRVIAFMLEKGWDYKTEYIFSETMPGYLGLERGDINVVMEIWTDAQKEWWDKVRNSGKVKDCGKVTPNAESGWYVPDFVIHGDPERGIDPSAPDLRTAEDLKRYYNIFKNPDNPDKGRFYNAPTGWSAHTINLDKLNAYGLSDLLDPFDPGSSTALSTAIKASYDKGQPVIAYYWAPTPLLGMLNMVMIEEPKYDAEKWEKNHGCASPAYTLAKGVNTEWFEGNPEAVSLIENYHISLEQTNESLAWMSENDNSAEKAAIWFLRKNPELWKSWVQPVSEEAAARIKTALE